MNHISWIDCVFTGQDLILSVAYVYLYWKRMKESEAFASERSKRRDAKTFKLLITANSIVLLLDVVQNFLLCRKIYIARYMCFPLICAIKLEVEFIVLNRLVKNTEKSVQSLQVPSLGIETSVAEVRDAEAGEPRVEARPMVTTQILDEKSRDTER
ncbi:hypothetical protein BU24DRAFT_427292 [Aaosphaeria arxii CBS 175.79]|uniref:Uncharacterized protein n=1 Tax=Aaosphaeria arxii CBS 175.79 TaxID=1450172 RepID=A0A6A5XDZ4_9PLEO|nr:uncharacterized protein BU24DRAFT_427292 [Aaosphaeria arxii CBS 175.79]KAF2011083.1 hypothetical protein BU24DRAFT_427292 [Aaosphaeria arxii CBS 175.79]